MRRGPSLFVGTPRPGIERVSKEQTMAKYWFDIVVWSGLTGIAARLFYGTADEANRAGGAYAVEVHGDSATVVGENHYREITVAD